MSFSSEFCFVVLFSSSPRESGTESLQGFLRFLGPAETKQGPRKRTDFHITNLRLEIFITSFPMYAHQENGQTNGKIGFLDQSDPFKDVSKKVIFHVMSLRLEFFYHR